MHREFLMGNEAMALGALAAGVDVVAGYPGTPSTEIIETVAKRNPGDVYVEWSVNEKAALEVAAGASYAGARSLVTMKCVGLNVAADPLMSLEYIGVKGGMVIVVADDPGPISSQTEQDTRTFAQFSKVPCLDPSGVADAYQMMRDAFALSEELHSPVFLRPTTRVDHGYEAIDVLEPEDYLKSKPEGFVKDSSKWVIFPRLSVQAHARIERRNAGLSHELSSYAGNFVDWEAGHADAAGHAGVTPDDSAATPAAAARPPRKAIATHGINYQYVRENLAEGECRVLRVATPFPFPDDLALEFLDGVDEVLCVEELDPVIERALTALAGRHHLDVVVRGKLTGDVKPSGENSVEYVGQVLDAFLGRDDAADAGWPDPPQLPVRPPVLCAGCPHRASFYAVKQAMRGKKTIYCGDIGCYTLGNARPLDMCDTCLCMGAGINIAQGVGRVEPDTHCFAFVGDSTFFASGITGVVNAFYNQANMTLCVLDNSTTAMTGHQPHPGTGRTALGEKVTPVSIERVLRAIGLSVVETVDPLDLQATTKTVARVDAEPGAKAIIFKSPCVFLYRPSAQSHVDPARCVGCQRCVKQLGCPALVPQADGKVKIDDSQCTGCTLCEQVCPFDAISGGSAYEA